MLQITYCLMLSARFVFIYCRRRRLKGIHSRSDTNRTGAKGLSFYYPRLLHCLDQMLAVMLLSQHRVLSSKTVRPRAPCGARCIGHAVSTWSVVCSEAPHSQFGEGARLHLCMDEWNRPTPVRRRLSLTQAARGKPIPTGLAPVPSTKHGSWKHFHSTPFSIYDLSIQKRGCQVWQGCPRDSAHLAQTGVWILVSLFLFFYFNLYIYPPDSQESDGGAIHRVSNYPDLLPEMPRYCCPLVS